LICTTHFHTQEGLDDILLVSSPLGTKKMRMGRECNPFVRPEYNLRGRAQLPPSLSHSPAGRIPLVPLCDRAIDACESCQPPIAGRDASRCSTVRRNPPEIAKVPRSRADQRTWPPCLLATETGRAHYTCSGQNRSAAACMPSDVCFDDDQSKAVETSNLQPTSRQGGRATTSSIANQARNTRGSRRRRGAWRSRVATETR
jgi:hypothetical protein